MGMQVQEYTPAEGLPLIRRTIKNVWLQIPGWLLQCTASAELRFVDAVYEFLGNAVAACDDVNQNAMDINGLKQYARDQYGDQNKDIVQDYVAWKDQCIVCRDWAEANGSASWTIGQPPPTVDATALAPLLTELQTLSE